MEMSVSSVKAPVIDSLGTNAGRIYMCGEGMCVCVRAFVCTYMLA